MRIPIANTKKQLAIIWFSGSGVLFALLLLQTIFGKYGTEISEIKDPWGLMLPTFIPTLSLIIGTLVADATASKDAEETATVDQFFFHLSRFLSIAYLVTVILTILLSPFAKLSLLELMKLSNLWLAPFQCELGVESQSIFFRVQLPVKHHLYRLEHRRKRWIGRKNL